MHLGCGRSRGWLSWGEVYREQGNCHLKRPDRPAPLRPSLYIPSLALGVSELHGSCFSHKIKLKGIKHRRKYSVAHMKQTRCCKYISFLGQLDSRGSLVLLTSKLALLASLFKTCPCRPPKGLTLTSSKFCARPTFLRIGCSFLPQG